MFKTRANSSNPPRFYPMRFSGGMAEIATGVLHNIGSVLNSVNVSTSLVAGKVRESSVDNLVALIHMLAQHNGDLPKFLANDPKGQRVLPYLAKLGRNAKQAIKQADNKEGRTIRISTRRPGERRVSLAVEDAGVGLPPENPTRIFGHGFTTKADGHSFGLHSCALAASRMGGSLRAEREGLGRGATFTVEFLLRTGEKIEERSLA